MICVCGRFRSACGSKCCTEIAKPINWAWSHQPTQPRCNFNAPTLQNKHTHRLMHTHTHTCLQTKQTIKVNYPSPGCRLSGGAETLHISCFFDLSCQSAASFTVSCTVPVWDHGSTDRRRDTKTDGPALLEIFSFMIQISEGGMLWKTNLDIITPLLNISSAVIRGVDT